MPLSKSKTIIVSKAEKLRRLISGPEVLTMPCCYDGLTARLVEDAGFPLTFMTGFGVSGAHGLPDTQARHTLFGKTSFDFGSSPETRQVRVKTVFFVKRAVSV